ncbi:hypothetical protein [Sphingobacterium sp. UGAL515B_05]|uniref:hypothetical protein n=1 Tax=Sphingobacterium sp. UGAL515B_05 TaxID=2986767 RepID=UPI002952C5EC|nr:hypothetical protein [Sphingobacterium sp. UGAL515B_05]WON93769.1 hypothetical protein OK025_21285 [Sphingobacterium sp. UGAL515B_05]
MLQHITWTQYFIAIFSLLIIYYVVYFIRFQRHRYSRFLDKLEEDSINEPAEEPIEKEQKEAEELLNQLEILVNRIRTGILEKAGTEATKDQILSGLAQEVASFGGLSQPAYQHALNNYIIEHAIRICGVEITEEELTHTWNSLPRFR